MQREGGGIRSEPYDLRDRFTLVMRFWLSFGTDPTRAGSTRSSS